MKKLFSIATISLLAITLSACSSDNGSSNKDSNSKTTTSAKPAKKSGISYDTYANVKVGNVLDGNGGSTIKAVKAALGKPTTETTTEVSGKKTTNLSWNKLSFNANSIDVAFMDGKAFSKGYTNLSLDKIKPLDASKVKSINTGTSYDDVISKLGRPQSETESGNGAMGSKIIVYTTKADGSSTSFTFMDNKLNSKTETKLS